MPDQAIAKEANDHCGGLEEDWCGEIKHSPILGNHIIAKRAIEIDEIVLEEFPLVQSPSVEFESIVPTDSPQQKIFICLNCCKVVTEEDKCAECQWPICKNGTCDVGGQHYPTECEILTSNSIRPTGTGIDYYGIEIIRYLRLRDSDPDKWAKILSFEAHIEERKNSEFSVNLTKQLTSFVRRCSFIDFSDEVIDHAIGVFSVNTYWSFRRLTTASRYASLLFHIGSLFAHDCNPNTKRELLEKEIVDENGVRKEEILLSVRAIRRIEPGDSITIRYIDCDQDYEKRQKELKELFYFECNCQRCVIEKQKNEVSVTKQD